MLLIITITISQYPFPLINPSQIKKTRDRFQFWKFEVGQFEFELIQETELKLQGLCLQEFFKSRPTVINYDLRQKLIVQNKTKISQLGWLLPIYGKSLFQTTNQSLFEVPCQRNTLQAATSEVVLHRPILGNMFRKNKGIRHKPMGFNTKFVYFWIWAWRYPAGLPWIVRI